MFRSIEVLARNTFKEVIRDRVLYVLIMFTLLLIGLCFAIGQLSYEEIFRLSVSLGLSSIHLCFCALTIFLGVSLFHREIEQRTIYTLLVRPIKRWQYLTGKYLGLMSVMFVLLLGFALSLTLILLVLGLPIRMTSFYPFIGIYLEGGILLAATFFFASFLTPYVAVGGAISLFLVGHWIQNLEQLIERSQSYAFVIVGRGITYITPNLSFLNWRDFAIADQPVSSLDYSYGIALTVAWVFIFFSMAQIIFNRRNFE